MTPLVSVIIPAYNAVETIIPCVNSVLNQTYKNIEIIVIDDGSTDATKIILEEYKEELCINNLQIIYQDNAGPSAARNLGIELAVGEYIAFLDSDDQWYPTKIEKQIKLYLENTELNLIGGLYSIGDKPVLTNLSSNTQQISLGRLMLKNYFITSTVMCPRKVLQICKFDVSQKYSEDYRLWLQISALRGKCLLQNDVLTRMNDKPLWGASGLSSHLWQMEKGELNNFMFMYKHSYISFFLFLSSSFFSVLKFAKRLLLSILI